MEASNKVFGQAIINFLLIIFQIGLFLSVFGFIFYFLLGVLELFLNDTLIPLDFPVFFSLDHSGTLTHDGQIIDGSFVMTRGMGLVKSSNLPQSFITSYRIICLLVLACIVFGLKLTVDILKAVKRGSFLIIENAIRLRKISFLCIGLYLFEILATLTSASYLSDKLQFSGIEFIGINRYLFSDLRTLLFSLFLLVISEAFRLGAQLKQEADLTI